MDVKRKRKESIPQERRSKRLASSASSATTPSSQALVDSSHPSASPSMFHGANNIVINGGQFTTNQLLAPIHGQLHYATSSTTTPSATSFLSSCELYQRYMSKMRAGTALWIPEPNRNLPLPNQNRGVSIGDVGIITEQGSFSFLFNICLPRDHPVNPSTIPEWFESIKPDIDPYDIREINEFIPGSHLASESITKVQADSETSLQAVSYEFVAQSGAGAVLVIPEGAISQDLENISKFRAYAAANLEHWYRYVNGTRGREIKNGDLRLVIGCDKATSWAIAMLPDSDRLRTIRLRPASKESPSFRSPYVWDLSGYFHHGRTGPLYLDTLAKENENFPPNINQCLFVRTMNLKLNAQEWKKVVQEQQPFQSLNLPSITIQSHKRRSPDQQEFLGFGLAYEEDELPPSPRSASVFLDQFDDAYYAVKPEDESANDWRWSSKLVPLELETASPIGQNFPVRCPESNALHNLMLTLFPEAKMAITEDDGHYQDLFADNLLPSDDQLLERVKELYEIVFDQDAGVVYLERKASPKDSGGAAGSGLNDPSESRS